MRREIYPHPELVTFYYLARYARQRRSDLVNMRRDHIDTTRDEMFVAQIKTGARIWVPMPKPLRDYLETRPRRGDYIVMSTKTPGAPWRETSLTDEFIQVTRELGFQTTDATGSRAISPHGLRHLCGVELAHASASDRQIAAVVGHSTLKQVQVYVKQAEQRILARDAQRKREEMYEREVFEGGNRSGRQCHAAAGLISSTLVGATSLSTVIAFLKKSKVAKAASPDRRDHSRQDDVIHTSQQPLMRTC